MTTVKRRYKSVAPEQNCCVIGNARVQFMTERLVRLEWNSQGVFEDRQTLAVVNRDFPLVEFSVEKTDNKTIIKTNYLTIQYIDDGKTLSADNLNITLLLNGQEVVWAPEAKDSENLGATIRTLDGIDGGLKKAKVANPDYIDNEDGKGQTGQLGQCITEYLEVKEDVDLGQGLISKSGWAVVDDSKNIVIDVQDGDEWVKERPEGEKCDFYFLGYGHDYKAALAEAAEVFGRQPLPSRYAFGYWWSRYWAYTDEEIENLIDVFDAMKVPIDVMVIDMDWHLEGWTGYTWDKRYFPDPDEFLAELKRRNIKVTLNLHPADGVAKHEEQFDDMADAMGVDKATADKVEFDITDPIYMKHYFEILHHPDEKRGVDFWWMDWQQGESTAMKGLDTLPWINQLHWDDMAENPARGDTRPLIFSRYGGIGAGRYCVGFSGDTHSTWESLAFQPYFTSTASNVLYGYWSHDIGGHMPGEIEPELYTRWMQYGMYSPVLRTHTTKNPSAERRVWEYPDPYNQIMMDVIRQRYELVPYIYTECRKAFDSGISLCRPMYYDYPECEEAYKAKNQYMFGEKMLVAPVIERCNNMNEMAEVAIWLPEGEWLDSARGTVEEGGQLIKRKYMIDEIPVFVRPGTIIPGQIDVKRLDEKTIKNLMFTIYAGDAGEYCLYEDDGISTGYEADEFVEINLSHKKTALGYDISIAPVKGSYNGFCSEKNVEIRLAGVVPPEQVKVGDEVLASSFRAAEKSWRYDGKTATLFIYLGARNIANGLDVEVVINQSYDQQLVDGLKGMMTRMKRINYYNTFATSARVLHEKERLGVEIAQAGNRISRNPEVFNEEVKAARAALGELGQMLQELSGRDAGRFVDQCTGTGNSRYDYCMKALAIIKEM